MADQEETTVRLFAEGQSNPVKEYLKVTDYEDEGDYLTFTARVDSFSVVDVQTNLDYVIETKRPKDNDE